MNDITKKDIVKREMKLYALAALNGAGYACAASTALVWAFPKLAKKAMGPKSRIVCGLAGFAWCVWQEARCNEQLQDKLYNLLMAERVEDAWNRIFGEDEAD